jgi:hypothetical protein
MNASGALYLNEHPTFIRNRWYHAIHMLNRGLLPNQRWLRGEANVVAMLNQIYNDYTHECILIHHADRVFQSTRNSKRMLLAFTAWISHLGPHAVITDCMLKKEVIVHLIGQPSCTNGIW